MPKIRTTLPVPTVCRQLGGKPLPTCRYRIQRRSRLAVARHQHCRLGLWPSETPSSPRPLRSRRSPAWGSPLRQPGRRRRPAQANMAEAGTPLAWLEGEDDPGQTLARHRCFLQRRRRSSSPPRRCLRCRASGWLRRPVVFEQAASAPQSPLRRHLRATAALSLRRALWPSRALAPRLRDGPCGSLSVAA